MKLDRTLMRLSSTDGATLARAARDLAHELPRRRVDVLGQFRAALAGLVREEPSPTAEEQYASGYRAALAEIAAAYQEAIEPQERERELARTIRSRANWPELISVLQARPQTPTELGRALRVDKAVVSRVLRDLKQLRLIEDVPLREGEDARNRPVALTPLGERVRLQIGDVLVPLLQPALRAFASVFGRILTERRITSTEMKAVTKGIAHEDESEPLSKLFSDIAREKAIATLDGDVLVGTEVGTERSLCEQLDEALQGSLDVPVLNQLESETVGSSCIYIRCAKTRERWDQLSGTRPKLAGIWTIDPGDMTVQMIPDPKPNSVLLYESPALLAADAESQLLAPLMKGIERKYCIAQHGTTLPTSFKRIAA
jgi:DNA-binding MarR family transcriptional regulator